MKQVLQGVVLYFFVNHCICPTLYEVQASKNCKLYSKKDNKTCSQLSITFKNIITNVQVDQLVHQYHKTFGKYSCDFYIAKSLSRFDPGIDNTEFFSWCYDAKLRSTAVDGQCFDGKNRYFAFFDRKSQKQQLVTIGLTEKLRSLKDTDSFVDDVVYRSMKTMDRSFIRQNYNKTIYFDEPTIELAVVVDDYFFSYMDRDEELTEMTTHQIVNGVSATYKHVGIRVMHSAYHRIGPEMSNKLSEGVSYYEKYLANLTRYYEHHVIFENQTATRWVSQIVGIPDMAVTLTHLRLADSLYGRMYTRSMCLSTGQGVVIVQDDYIPGTMIAHAANIMAHEMAHSLGLDHVHPSSECTCELTRGLCTMSPMGPVERISGQWTECSRNEIEDVIYRSRREKNCLFTKDVFTNEEVDRNPYTIAEVDLKATFIGSNNLTMNLKSQLFEHQSLQLHKSFDGQLPNGHVCSYYHNKPGRQFAAFHWCGSSAKNSHWTGMFHLPETVVRINYHKRRGIYVAHRYATASSHTSDHILPNQGNKFEIDVSVAIRPKFENQFYANNLGNYDDLLPYVMGTINMADALYRLNGIRIRLKEVKEHKVIRNVTILNSMIVLTFSAEGDYDSNDHTVRDCKQAMSARWNLFHEDQQLLALDVAHSIGHQLGLQDHPDYECGCVTRHGLCFMYKEMKPRGFVWSACDAEQLKSLTDSCHRFVKPMQRRVSSYYWKIVILYLIIVVELIFMLLLVAGNYTGLIHPFI